jgi:hypothetical protein
MRSDGRMSEFVEDENAQGWGAELGAAERKSFR